MTDPAHGAPPEVIRPELRAEATGPPRVPVRDDLPADVAELLSKVESGTKPLGVFRRMAHAPVVTKRAALLAAGLLGKGALPAREREIAILRVGWRCGSLYEFAEHTRIGIAEGLSREEITAVTMPVERAGLADDDLAILTFVDELYDGNAVTAATWERLRERWTEGELLELVMLVGFYWMMSGFLNVARVPLEDGSPGWPDGRVPPGLSA